MLQLILQAISYPFGPRLAWITGLLGIALSLLIFGFFLTKPPSQFSETPPRIGLVLAGNCGDDLAVYSTLDHDQNILLGVSVKASEPEAYSSTFRRLADEVEASVSYAPLSDEIDCDRMRLAVVGPPKSSVTPVGAVFGDIIVQNHSVGSSRRSGIVETALREDENGPGSDRGSADQVRDGARAKVGFVSTADFPEIIKPAESVDTDYIGPESDLLGTTDPDFGGILQDCIGSHGASHTDIDLSEHPCVAFVEAEALPGFVGVAIPSTRCAQPVGAEPVQCMSTSGLVQRRIAPVALLFKIDCPECRKGQRFGFSLEAIFTQMSAWISGNDKTVSLTALSTDRKAPTPWRDDDAARTKRFDDWVSTTKVGAYSTTIDSYVWQSKNMDERRQFNLMWGAIILGLGMTILIELLIVSIHPGIRLQTTPPDEDGV
ncbi:MAG: hypothetical protein ACE37M_12800 [Henriciella sp.]